MVELGGRNTIETIKAHLARKLQSKVRANQRPADQHFNCNVSGEP